jgi:hypothetical protein
MKVRNDSGKDINLSLMGEEIKWDNGAVIELSERQWNLIMGSTDLERESAKTYWGTMFPDRLPQLVPLRGRSASAPETKEE